VKFPHDQTYDPAFPSVRIILRNDRAELNTREIEALLDTGSDASLVPIDYLEKIHAAALTDIRIRSHWGEWRTAQLFVVDLQIANEQLPGIFVVGDELGDRVLLGRNVINRLRLRLDGVKLFTEII
jgi:predicted aspartyl protease